MTDLTPEELAEDFDELVEMAVDEALSIAYDEKVTAAGLQIMLKKYHVGSSDGMQAAFNLLKSRGKRIYS